MYQYLRISNEKNKYSVWDKVSSYTAIVPIFENIKWEKKVIDPDKRHKLSSYGAIVSTHENIKWKK